MQSPKLTVASLPVVGLLAVAAGSAWNVDASAAGCAGLRRIASRIPVATPDEDAAARATVGGMPSPDSALLAAER